MRVSGLRCSDCQDEEVIAVWPGDAGEEGTLFVLLPNRPVRAWCDACWQKRYAQKRALPLRGSKAKAALSSHQ